MSSQPAAYILRIARDEVERQLYVRKSFYVGIRRDWSRGSKVLFVRKAESFIGSAVLDRIAALDELDEDEKKLCFENNWYGKMLFAKVTRFHPHVPVRDTVIAGQNTLVLHGAEISIEDASKIEALASSRITT